MAIASFLPCIHHMPDHTGRGGREPADGVTRSGVSAQNAPAQRSARIEAPEAQFAGAKVRFGEAQRDVGDDQKFAVRT
jgi:hypothetical protein